MRGMTDDEVRTIQARVTSFLDDQDGRGLDVGNPSHFAQLVDRARAGFVDIAEDDLPSLPALHRCNGPCSLFGCEPRAGYYFPRGISALWRNGARSVGREVAPSNYNA